jgi:glycosyltransferase involved in cell wall biosynthesis
MIKRILMTGDTVGGVWTYTMELAEALGAHGVEVVLAALGGPPTGEQRLEASRIPNLDVLASDFKLEWMDDPWRDVAESGHWLLDLDEQYAPDIVHLNSYGHGSLPWSAPVVVTAHSCVLSWWQAVKGCAAPAEWGRYRDTVRASLNAAHVVTAPSAAMADAVANHYAVANCRVIANGRCPSRFRRAVKEPFVLTAGRLWDEAKNVAAVARIADRLPWPVYVAGEVLHPSGQAAQFGACTVLGRLAPAALSDWYSRAAIYALPARYEPFGLSALEAAHSGCALVLGDIPSLREIWGDSAVFVPPHDTEALAKAVAELIAAPERRAGMADAAWERASQFTPRRMAEGYLAAYRSIVPEGRELCAS